MRRLVMARGVESKWSFSSSAVRSNDDGTFTLEGERAGDYRVIAYKGQWWGGDEMHKPGGMHEQMHGKDNKMTGGMPAASAARK